MQNVKSLKNIMKECKGKDRNEMIRFINDNRELLSNYDINIEKLLDSWYNNEWKYKRAKGGYN